MNVGEYGHFIRIQCDENLVGRELSLELKSPTSKTISSKTPIIGGSDFTEDGINFISGQYAEYKVLEGDIEEAGVWEVRLNVKDNNNTSLLKTERRKFTVRV